MHGVASDKGINHPNQYFEESQRILNNKSGGAVAKTKGKKLLTGGKNQI